MWQKAPLVWWGWVLKAILIDLAPSAAPVIRRAEISNPTAASMGDSWVKLNSGH